MSAATELRAIQQALEQDALRLIDAAAGVPDLDGRQLRRAGQAVLEVAGVVEDLTARVEGMAP